MRDRCKVLIPSRLGVSFKSCSRRAVKGEFCAQHHPDSVAKRRAKSWARYDAMAKTARYRFAEERAAEQALSLLRTLVAAHEADIFHGTATDIRLHIKVAAAWTMARRLLDDLDALGQT
jgi:hypothetical protein